MLLFGSELYDVVLYNNIINTNKIFRERLHNIIIWWYIYYMKKSKRAKKLTSS